MDSKEATKELVLRKIAGGRQMTRLPKSKVTIDGKIFHYRLDTYHANGKYPFNINPNSLSADYEVWICGSENIYFLIPINEIVQIYNSGVNPNRTPGQESIITVDIYTDNNKIKYRNGKEKDFSGYRNKILIDYNNTQVTIQTQAEVQIKKYGIGGEGEAHLKFKNFIAENHSLLGIENVEQVENDNHIFPSADRPDIIFICSNNKFFIVEIEIENCMPGAYQAIKYKALLCAEKGLPLNSENVTTMLVARKISPDVKNFCLKYNVKTFEFKEIHPAQGSQVL